MNNVKIFFLLTLFVTLSSALDLENEVKVIKSEFENGEVINSDSIRKIEKRAVSPSSCLSKLYVIVFTSNLNWAGSDTSHKVQIQYNGYVKTMTLYDRPGDDYLSNKGDLWELSLSGCVKFLEIQRVSILEGGNDGWNIGSIVTLVSDSSDIQLLTRDFNVNRWIDGNGASSHRRFDLSLSRSKVNPDSCLSKLYVMGFTSNLWAAGSDTSHGIQIQYNNGAVKTMTLYDRPGDDYKPNKGDLWELSLSGWHCIKLRDIIRVSIFEKGNDGWNIESIVTLVSDSSNIDVLTRDFHVNRWIDGNGASSHKQFDLTLPGSCTKKIELQYSGQFDGGAETVFQESYNDVSTSEVQEDEEDINEKTGAAEMPHMFGDLLLTPEQEKALIINSDEEEIAQGYLETAKKWPGGVIPYTIEYSLSAKARQAISKAMAEFQAKSCIRFVNRSPQSHPNYVHFVAANGCWSYFGVIGGQQKISIGKGCESKGIVQHEILHALGRVHEQSRPDRDSYVTINQNNIEKGKEHNFKKMKADTSNLPYDYGSVMHYGSHAFSRNGQATITPRQSTVSIGQRDGLSGIDWTHVKRAYCGCG